MHEQTSDFANSDNTLTTMKGGLLRRISKSHELVGKSFKGNEGRPFKFLRALENNLHEKLMGGEDNDAGLFYR